MLRRKPTRIELKLDDLEEYETIKKEREAERKASQSTSTQTPGKPHVCEAMITILNDSFGQCYCFLEPLLLSAGLPKSQFNHQIDVVYCRWRRPTPPPQIKNCFACYVVLGMMWTGGIDPEFY